MRVLIVLSAVVAAVLVAAGPGTAGAGEPTCSGTYPIDLGIDVHGQHIIRDYVMGPGSTLTWPPSGGVVGQAVAGNGADVAGGPGAGHMDGGVAPGASFCVPQAQSPGWPHS